MKLDKKLKQEIDKRNITKEMLANQMLAFIKGSATICLDRIATVGDGVSEISSIDRSKYMNIYNLKQQDIDVLKFVPASGLASRMFKGLSEFYNSKTNNPMSQYFFNNLHKFPFYKDIIIEFHKIHPQIKKLDNLSNKLLFLEFILCEDGLNYQNTPKGLIKFHQYDIDNKSALEEQIDEGYYYAIGKNQTVQIHFTVNHLFLEEFKKRAQEYIAYNYNDSDVTFHITFSTQKTSTDTIALNQDNTPFINSKGNYVFRAGGHGALIENLNDLDADLIFIKNIDNVSHQNHVEENIKYKQVLAGKLLFLQEKIHQYLSLIDSDSPSLNLQEVRYFIMENFLIEFDENCDTSEIFAFLNRPIRVCGMIKNQGDAGGGPFWIKEENNTSSLQIIEGAQVDKNDKTQKEILYRATHFNPVDIVCATKDYKANKFNLIDYVNQDAVFITDKTVEGKAIKGLELPGLWNGGMHHWLSVFVEVPIETFNPVKTVTDLLSPMHQA